MRLLAVLGLILFTQISFAGMAEDFEVLKNEGRDLEATGSICEEVARLRFSEKYPAPDYSVVVGIQYADKTGNTIGELDLVVFDNKTQIAHLIAEVKCYTSPKSGLKKAKDQRKRFMDHVHSPKALQFRWLKDKTKKLTKTQFNKTNNFLFIGQKNTTNVGYQYELPYTLPELMKMRADIMDCQTKGACARPTY